MSMTTIFINQEQEAFFAIFKNVCKSEEISVSKKIMNLIQADLYALGTVKIIPSKDLVKMIETNQLEVADKIYIIKKLIEEIQEWENK